MPRARANFIEAADVAGPGGPSESESSARAAPLSARIRPFARRSWGDVGAILLPELATPPKGAFAFARAAVYAEEIPARFGRLT